MSGIPAGAGSLLGKRLGKYEILALLALGGTAEIYLARIGGAAGFEKYVVVKCLHDHLADDAEFVKMFLDEARLAAHLDHSNIVQTMELGEHENRYYMVMEFLAGLSLAMIVRRAGERLPGGRVPVPLVLNMIAQSCAGLHYAHERVMNGKPLNIVHRDISPQNLVVSFEGVVKVVDFGIAKAELRETRTQSGTIKGKFAYMSPEQCVANNVDRRTDVFALGVIAHELLTGRRLFKKPSPYETYQAVIECAVEPPSRISPDVDPSLDPIIMRAVEKDKEKRFPTAEAFGDAILSYLHHRGKGSGPGDVSRFFEASFAQEIEEHGARMRELIAGRDIASEAGGTWGADEDEAKHTVDIAHGEAQPGVVDELGSAKRGSAAEWQRGVVDKAPESSLSEVIGDLAAAVGDGEDMPAERTRIEANPLERLNELEAEAKKQKPASSGKTPKPVVTKTPTGPSPVSAGPLPSLASGGLAGPGVGVKPPSVPPGMPPGATPPGAPAGPLPSVKPAGQGPAPQVMPPSGALPLPTIPTGPIPIAGVRSVPIGSAPAGGPGAPNGPAAQGGPSRPPGSGKFPDAANLPTMIAEPDDDDDDDGSEPPELARTELLGSLDVRLADSNPPQMPDGAPRKNEAASARTVIEMVPPDLARPGGPGGPPMGPQGGPMNPQGGPMNPQGGPMNPQGGPMNPQGGPMNPQGGPMNPQGGPPMGPQGGPPMGPPGPMGQRPPIDLGPGGYPVMNAQMRDQMTSGATVFPSERSQPPPSSHQPGMGMGGGMGGGMPGPPGGPYQDRPQWGPGPMGPGPGPGAMRGGMPPWKLAAIFVGALGGALLITILIALAAR